jgi:ketosteroid isomerase-like protein
VIRLDREWSEALPREDIPVLQRILSDDYIFTTIVGNVITKAWYMKKSEDNHLLSLKTEDVKVRVYGDAAVVTGRVKVGLLDRTDLARYTNVYAKRQGRWQLTTTQFTRIVKP